MISLVQPLQQDFPREQGLSQEFVWAISRGPRCGIHHQFPWESISQPNTFPKWAELCDAQPKHFHFISLFLFMLLVLDKFKKLIMCHKKLMARTINILYNFTNPASVLFRFCDTLPACCISKCIKKKYHGEFFFP